MKKLNNKGFTLVELIVVIAILGVLMAVLVPQYIQYVEKSRIGTDESYIGEVAHSMELAAAANSSINGQSVTVTLVAKTGLITVTDGAAGVAKTASDAMKTELTSVFPTSVTGATGAVSQIYKSRYYSNDGAGNGAHTLTLDANGQVTITGTTSNKIGTYKTA